MDTLREILSNNNYDIKSIENMEEYTKLKRRNKLDLIQYCKYESLYQVFQDHLKQHPEEDMEKILASERFSSLKHYEKVKHMIRNRRNSSMRKSMVINSSRDNISLNDES